MVKPLDYSNYEKQLQNMMNQFVFAEQVNTIIEQTDIFQDQAFDTEVEAVQGDAAKADTIAHRVKRTIGEKIEEDPVLYEKLSVIIDKAIKSYKERRISDAEYLAKMRDVLNKIRGKDKSIYPDKIRHCGNLKAYFGIIKDKISLDENIIADIAIKIDKIIEYHKIRDWIYNKDVQNAMDIDIEECLFNFKDKYNFDLSLSGTEYIIDRFITVAKRRDL